MRLTVLAALALTALSLTGCNGTNRNSAVTNTSPNQNGRPAATSAPAASPAASATDRTAQKNGWWVRICTSKTEASGVDLEIGLGGNSGSHRYWRKWRSNDPAEFDVPDDFRTVQEIWIKGTADPRDRNVHMCTYYRDRSTQKMTFDNNEEHETSQGDSDDCDC